MRPFDVDAYYGFVVQRFPEVAAVPGRIREAEGDHLYPMLTRLLAPLLVNVGMHGAQVHRRQVFDLADDFIERFPEVTNEIGAGIVEIAPEGWFAAARPRAGDRLRERLHVWEPGWTTRRGRPTRVPDPYGVEKALRLGGAPPA